MTLSLFHNIIRVWICIALFPLVYFFLHIYLYPVQLCSLSNKVFTTHESGWGWEEWNHISLLSLPSRISKSGRRKPINDDTTFVLYILTPQEGRKERGQDCDLWSSCSWVSLRKAHFSLVSKDLVTWTLLTGIAMIHGALKANRAFSLGLEQVLGFPGVLVFLLWVYVKGGLFLALRLLQGKPHYFHYRRIFAARFPAYLLCFPHVMNVIETWCLLPPHSTRNVNALTHWDCC